MRSITSSIAKIMDMIVRVVHKVLRKILQWYLNNVQGLLPAYLPKHDCFVLQLLVLIEANIAWPYNILYINEAHFYLQNVFNTENCTETTKNPKIYQLLPLHSPKMTLKKCVVRVYGIFCLGLYFFEDVTLVGSIFLIVNANLC